MTVQKITQVSSVDCSMYSAEEVDALVKLAEQYGEEYAQYDCVTHSVSQMGNELLETIVIDTTDMDELYELSDAGLVPLELENTSFISLEKTAESLKGLSVMLTMVYHSIKIVQDIRLKPTFQLLHERK